MFNNLSDRLSNTLGKLRGTGRLTEKNIQDAVADVRRALIEADVALPVVKTFTNDIKEKVVGKEIVKSVRPGEAFIKLVEDELTHVLGDEQAELNLNAPAPQIGRAHV